jgi:2-polyprenyl-3-methyl-5-hydroxy-6-metoxy-1,4-benzoquinol methylase
MRDIVCAVCGGTDRQVVYESTLARAASEDGRLDPESAHYQINRCNRCSLLYSSPIFEPNEVQLLYTESEHDNLASKMGGEERNVRRTMELYYGLARPHLSGRERILDVGCDTGIILETARGDGFRELYGIEPVPVAAAEAERIPGAHISTRFYEDEQYPDAYFDLITLIHVLDHLVDPINVLEKAWTQLKPGGVIVAVVHNSGSLVANVLGERFPAYNLYHHYFFDKRALRRLFRRGDFEVLRAGPTFNCYSLGFFLHKAPILPPTVKQMVRGALDGVGVGRLPLTVPIGNVGIVARRPLVDARRTSDSPSRVTAGVAR